MLGAGGVLGEVGLMEEEVGDRLGIGLGGVDLMVGGGDESVALLVAFRLRGFQSVAEGHQFGNLGDDALLLG